MLGSLYCDHDRQFVRCSPLRCKGTTKALVLGGGRDSSDPYILTVPSWLGHFRNGWKGARYAPEPPLRATVTDPRSWAKLAQAKEQALHGWIAHFEEDRARVRSASLGVFATWLDARQIEQMAQGYTRKSRIAGEAEDGYVAASVYLLVFLTCVFQCLFRFQRDRR